MPYLFGLMEKTFLSLLGDLKCNGKIKRDKQEFLSIKERLVNEESWIIEG